MIERRTERPGAGSILLCGNGFFLPEFTFSTSLRVFYSQIYSVQSHAPTFVRTLKSLTLAATATPLFGPFSCTAFLWIHKKYSTAVGMGRAAVALTQVRISHHRLMKGCCFLFVLFFSLSLIIIIIIITEFCYEKLFTHVESHASSASAREPRIVLYKSGYHHHHCYTVWLCCNRIKDGLPKPLSLRNKVQTHRHTHRHTHTHTHTHTENPQYTNSGDCPP